MTALLDQNLLVNHASLPLTNCKGLPYIGISHKIKKDPLNFLSALVNSSSDIIEMEHLGQKVFLVNSPELVEHILVKNHKNFIKGHFYNKLKPMFRAGLPVLDGKDWKKHRQLMAKSFRKDQINNISNLSIILTDKLVKEWLPQSGPLNVDTAMAKLALDIVAQSLFGSNIEKYSDGIIKAIDYMLLFSEDRIWDPLDRNWNYLSPNYWKFKSARNYIDKVIFEFVDRRKSGETFGADLLGILIAALGDDPDTSITYQELRDEVTSMLILGHESTAKTLTWLFYLLAQHQGVQNELYEEIVAIIGDSEPNETHFENMPFLKAVISETLRLYPASWSIARKNVHQETLLGVNIPAGSNLWLSPYLMHRNRKYYKTPEAFRPERFLNAEMHNTHKYAYFPFAAGPRGCIGEGMAWQEIMCITAILCRKFVFELAPGQRVEPVARISVKPSNGMHMILSPR